MNKIHNYIEEIDFELVDDAEVLKNVYNEIKGHEKDLISHQDTHTQMERLLRASTSQQIFEFTKRISIEQLINQSLGSRILEVILDKIFHAYYIENAEIDMSYLVTMFEDNLVMRMVSKNSTFVMRKFFQLVSGKKIEKDKVIKYPRTSSLGIRKYKSIIETHVYKFTSDESIITMLVYLQCYHSQSLIAKAIDQNFDIENLRSPKQSYFCEGIAKIASPTNLSKIFDIVQHDIMALCMDKYANYFMSTLIDRIPDKSSVIYHRLVFSEFAKNSTVVYNLLLALQKTGNTQLIEELVINFYGVSGDLLKQFLLSRDSLDSKYVDAVVNFMKMEKNNYNVNDSFKKHFNLGWVNTQAGRKLIMGYFRGVDNKDNKREFLDMNTKMCKELIKKSDGRKILRAIDKFASKNVLSFINRLRKSPRYKQDVGSRLK